MIIEQIDPKSRALEDRAEDDEGMLLIALTSKGDVDILRVLNRSNGWDYDWFYRVWHKPVDGLAEINREILAILALGLRMRQIADTSTEPIGIRFVLGVRRHELLVRWPPAYTGVHI